MIIDVDWRSDHSGPFFLSPGAFWLGQQSGISVADRPRNAWSIWVGILTCQSTGLVSRRMVDVGRQYRGRRYSLAVDDHWPPSSQLYCPGRGIATTHRERPDLAPPNAGLGPRCSPAASPLICSRRQIDKAIATRGVRGTKTDWCDILRVENR